MGIGDSRLLTHERTFTAKKRRSLVPVWLIGLSLFQLDDTALQLYRDGDYGSYLDLEASISEQQEEFDGFQTK